MIDLNIVLKYKNYQTIPSHKQNGTLLLRKHEFSFSRIFFAKNL